MPVPLRLTACGHLIALSAKVSVPLVAPSAVGVKVTPTVQVAPAAIPVPHVLLEMLNGPPAGTEMPVNVSAVLRRLVTVTVFAALVLPSASVRPRAQPRRSTYPRTRAWPLRLRSAREEKDTLGVGQAQSGNVTSVPKQPDLAVASCSALLPASLQSFGAERGKALRCTPHAAPQCPTTFLSGSHHAPPQGNGPATPIARSLRLRSH